MERWQIVKWTSGKGLEKIISSKTMVADNGIQRWLRRIRHFVNSISWVFFLARMCWSVVSTQTDSPSSSAGGLSIVNQAKQFRKALRYREGEEGGKKCCTRPLWKRESVSILQGLLISCNQMSAEYLFMTDKLYDVKFDTGDKVIQCGRHNDIFKLWLQWRAKVQNSSRNCNRKPISRSLVTRYDGILPAPVT